MSNSKYMKIGGLWENTNQQGQKFLIGRFTYDSKILIVENKDWQKEGDPTHVILLCPYEQQQQTRPPAPPRSGQQGAAGPAPGRKPPEGSPGPAPWETGQGEIF